MFGDWLGLESVCLEGRELAEFTGISLVERLSGDIGESLVDWFGRLFWDLLQLDGSHCLDSDDSWCLGLDCESL